ncbi:MBL fold metallo-hydrolase [Streptomyces sp. NPDC002994]|uniref:MBL fold metallo-hydrolase n=1 Tax=Streptomyces sp. NPDC002994 TaxID=3154441 RepID=UPI0033A1DCB4
MCDVVARVLGQGASLPESSRRRFLQALGATTVGGLAAAGAGAQPAAALTAKRPGASGHRTRLVLLGTAGGPAWLDGDRCGTSSALVHRDRVYLVDLGAGAQQRLVASGLGVRSGLGSSLSAVRAIFLTHLHSDHVTDWPALYATAPMNTVGRTLPAIEVFGPGDRGTLPRLFPAGRPAPPVFSPDDPTPGIAGMTGYLRQAFGHDFNDRARDSNFTSPDALFSVHDIDLSGTWNIDPEGKPPRLTSPLPVWEDGDVRVTATLVDHHPTAPAFAYRFDTPDGSVVFSGDTGVSENLIDLARGADYLVHEVIDPEFVDRLVGTLPPETGGPLREHLLAAHTTIEQVGRDVAEPAGVKNLVLNHLVPGNNPAERWRAAQRGYSGRIVVGEDLLQLPVGRPH